MSLSTALNIANSALFNTGRQTATVSRNSQEQGNADYVRRTAVTVSGGGTSYVQVQRQSDDQLLRQSLSTSSSWSGQNALSNAMEQLEVTVNGVDSANSAATALGKLQQALQTYTASPSNSTLAQATVEAARAVVNSLNSGTTAIQSLRTDADQQIGAAVDELNGLLSDFKQANDAVISATRSGRDSGDALDQRDAILKKIAQYVPVSTHSRANGDLALTTKDGVTLFETVPRSVTFTQTTVLSAGSRGGTVSIDNVPLSGGSGADTDAQGKIAGLLQARDDVSVKLQSQLDEVARGLISVFSEKASPAGSAPDKAGLFTWSGAPGVPAAGTLVSGLAGTISLNAAFDGSAGGNPSLLRDGGANGAAYVQNTTGAAGYTTRLLSYADGIDASMAFDPAAGAGTAKSLSAYTTATIGWFEGVRQSATNASETKQALSARSQEALSNGTGVNIDTEMALLLDLEHSYQASARIIKTVDEMMATLMSAVS